MEAIDGFVGRTAEYFKSQVGPSLVEVYKLGSLAHGGFSQIYSDIDVGLLLCCDEPPAAIGEMIANAKALDPTYGRKLSVFWGNPDFTWGRLPNLDRLDMLDHGVALLAGHKPRFRRPTKDEIRSELLRSIERSWQPRLPELNKLKSLAPENRKPYIRAILYAARLIFSWDNLAMESNDLAVAYLYEVKPKGLELKPIDMALACRLDQCTAEDVFALGTDLCRQSERAVAYISQHS